MGAGQLVLDLVNVVIILNYAVQCQLVVHYIRGITRRIEEKSTNLQSIMKVLILIFHLANIFRQRCGQLWQKLKCSVDYIK